MPTSILVCTHVLPGRGSRLLPAILIREVLPCITSLVTVGKQDQYSAHVDSCWVMSGTPKYPRKRCLRPVATRVQQCLHVCESWLLVMLTFLPLWCCRPSIWHIFHLNNKFVVTMTKLDHHLDHHPNFRSPWLEIVRARKIGFAPPQLE